METLASRIAREGALNTTDAVGWIVRLARSLERTHARGSVHGRVSPQCILIELEECASAGRLVDPERAPDLLAYHSPERIAGEALSPSDDTWALAATLYEAIAGAPPFRGEDGADTRAQIQAARPAVLSRFDVSDDGLQDILDRALAREWMDRTNNIAALRRELEGWRPGARFAALPPLEDPRKPGVVPPSGRARTILDEDEAPTVARFKGLPGEPDEEEEEEEATLVASAREILARSKPKEKEPAPPSSASPVKSRDSEDQFDFKGLRSRLLSATTEYTPGGAPGSIPPSTSARIAAAPELHEPTPVPSSLATSLLREAEALPALEDPVPAEPSVAAADPPAVAPPPAPAPAPAPEPVLPIPVPVQPTPEPSGGGARTTLLFVAVIVLAAVGAFLMLRPKRALPAAPTAPTSTTADAPSAAPTSAATTPASAATTAAPVETAAPIAAGSASAEPGASATSAPVAPAGDLSACIRPLFASDTFSAGPLPDFTYMCQETDPRRGGATTKSRVVLGNTGHTSDGMKEWALQGWYEMASFAVLRARCCPGAPSLKLPETPGSCVSLDRRLNELGAAALEAKDAKDAKLKEAVENYTGSIHCLVRSGSTAPFVRHDNPQGGEDTAFLKTLARVVASNR